MSEIKHTPEGWKHKDAWSRKGNNFMVEITRHSAYVAEFYSEGPNRWCVYAYIYPAHPHFVAFSGPSIFQDAGAILHFHGGCSYLEFPMYEGKVTCVKVGADYHHLYDERFTHYATTADAYEVFADADELFEQLQTRLAMAKSEGQS
jgi:hypothetical protein